jgi:hypothetical protein
VDLTSRHDEYVAGTSQLLGRVAVFWTHPGRQDTDSDMGRPDSFSGVRAPSALALHEVCGHHFFDGRNAVGGRFKIIDGLRLVSRTATGGIMRHAECSDCVA